MSEVRNNPADRSHDFNRTFRPVRKAPKRMKAKKGASKQIYLKKHKKAAHRRGKRGD